MSRDKKHKRKYSILDPCIAGIQCEGNGLELS